VLSRAGPEVGLRLAPHSDVNTIETVRDSEGVVEAPPIYTGGQG